VTVAVAVAGRRDAHRRSPWRLPWRLPWRPLSTIWAAAGDGGPRARAGARADGWRSA